MKPILELELDNQELNALQYPIIVEMWDKLSGSRRRKYNETFTEQERKTIRYYHKLFYNWHLVKGTPQKHRFKSIPNINLIQKAVNFFATI